MLCTHRFEIKSLRKCNPEVEEKNIHCNEKKLIICELFVLSKILTIYENQYRPPTIKSNHFAFGKNVTFAGG